MKLLKTKLNTLLIFLPFLFSAPASADIIYELDGSPYATENAPLAPHFHQKGEKVIIVDPNAHVWGAYQGGRLIRWGLATAGASHCRDLGRPCKTKAGTFRIHSLGDSHCFSKKFPLAEGGGAPMPYCMYFNGGQALHGSNEVVYGNASHGCVRIHIDDARWLRYSFVEAPSAANGYRGTKVIIKPY